MAFEPYPYSPRLPLAYPSDDYLPTPYPPAYDRGAYRHSVRPPYLPPRPVPMRHSSYDAGYRGYDGYAGGRGDGYVGGRGDGYAGGRGDGDGGGGGGGGGG